MEVNVPLALVGNKADLPERTVKMEKVTELAKVYNAQLFQTSAKTGENIDKVFAYLAKEMAKRIPKPRSIGLKIVKKSTKRKSCC